MQNRVARSRDALITTVDALVEHLYTLDDEQAAAVRDAAPALMDHLGALAVAHAHVEDALTEEEERSRQSLARRLAEAIGAR